MEAIKYSAGISFSKKKKKIITLDFPTESALSVLTAVAKRREKEGRHKGRKEEERKGRGKGMTALLSLSKGQYNIYGEAESAGPKILLSPSHFILSARYIFLHSAYQ